MKKFSRLDYCQYLLSSQINYTLTNFADHVENVQPDIDYSDNGYLLFDDTVIDKDSSNKIEGVRHQYSGNCHGIVKGIGVVTCVYVNPELEKFWVIDYRIFDPDKDGKSKIDHLEDMLNHTEYKKLLPFTTVLVDSWYATHKLILKIDDMGKTYYCPLKKNRLVNDKTQSEEKPSYERIENLVWSQEELKSGKTVHINKFPRQYEVKLFQVTISTNRTEHIATNAFDQESSSNVRDECAIRWKIEEFHREVKQLAGLEKCQCRKNRIQRNHIACSMLTWVYMKRTANKLKKTIYKVKHDLLKDYLVQELRSPRLVFA